MTTLENENFKDIAPTQNNYQKAWTKAIFYA